MGLFPQWVCPFLRHTDRDKNVAAPYRVPLPESLTPIHSRSVKEGGPARGADLAARLRAVPRLGP